MSGASDTAQSRAARGTCRRGCRLRQGSRPPAAAPTVPTAPQSHTCFVLLHVDPDPDCSWQAADGESAEDLRARIDALEDALEVSFDCDFICCTHTMPSRLLTFVVDPRSL